MRERDRRNTWLQRLRAISQRYPAVFVAAAFFAAFMVYAVLPNDTLFSATLEALALAVLALVLVALRAPETQRSPTRAMLVPFWRTCVPVVGVAVIGVALNLPALAGAYALAPVDLLSRGALLCAYCLATGLFEEGLFRVVAIGAFMQALGSNDSMLRHPLVVSATASALLFALLHAGPGIDGMLKPVAAALFGFVMAALYAQTRNLWPPALVHALYNAVALGPYVLLGDDAQRALLGGDMGVVVAVATIVLLIPPAAFAFARLRRMERQRG